MISCHLYVLVSGGLRRAGRRNTCNNNTLPYLVALSQGRGRVWPPPCCPWSWRRAHWPGEKSAAACACVWCSECGGREGDEVVTSGRCVLVTWTTSRGGSRTQPHSLAPQPRVSRRPAAVVPTPGRDGKSFPGCPRVGAAGWHAAPPAGHSVARLSWGPA